MKLVIFNGSPRLKKSNSTLLTESFLNGYNNGQANAVPVLYLGKINNSDEHLKAFEEAEIVLFIFPLYTDSMPGIVMHFFEKLIRESSRSPRKIGFIVQSGFPEAVQTDFIKPYLEKFTKRLNCIYLGTVTKGGVEGIQMMPPLFTKKLFRRFTQLGQHFAAHEVFDEKLVKKLAGNYRMSSISRMFFRFFKMLGFTNFYWNHHLKKNNALHRCFDRPLGKN